MSSFSGYVTYLKFTAGSNKGKVGIGDEFNSPFALKQTNNEKAEYTSSKVSVTSTAFTAGTAITLKWSPVQVGSILVALKTTADATPSSYVFDKPNGDVYQSTSAPVTTEVVDSNGNITVDRSAEGESKLTVTTDYVIDYGKTRDGAGIGDANATDVFGSITIKSTVTGASTATKADVSYIYNNVYIPQNDIPLLNAEMAAIPLVAHARRIAVYYSNLAAFQAKTDYGFDMGPSLADQAVAQLSYEIDTEIVNGLHEAASTNTDASTVLPMLTFSKTLPIGVSMQEHFASFSNIIEKGKAVVYKRTKRFSPTYMVIAADIMPVLAFVPGFKAASTSGINGPYFAGTVGGLKVFVSPALEDGVFFFGVNGSDAQTSAAVYAPYMAIVPTQLLGFADGAMSQGFSTLYDFKILNPLLLAEGRVTE